ncbi:MAG: serine/threonine protein kinase, partial [Bdellovibrionales bacterium]|nr:serine/threonine protein kinase [Bdellovibrionales bacterium]
MSTRFIDKYEIVSTLGRGSMGVVYKGRDPEIGRLVAIKTLKSVFMGDDPAGAEALQRFRLESRSAGKLHHPNIVTIFEAGRTESGSPYIVMEFIDGSSLESMIAQSGPLEPLGVLHYLSQIAGAIDYAHSQNVIHRDIKPSNILIDEHHRPHLLDFGVAKLSDTSLTPAGTVVGTPSYMSPEQIRGAKLDGRTDLFSLAVVAFEAFTGVRPFPGSDFTTVVSNIIHKEPLSFREVGAELPQELEAALRRGLAKDREDRLPQAVAFVESLAAVFGVELDPTGL